jgi:hypothetical protein
MVEFSLWTRIEQAGPKRFVAKVTAIPCDVEQRCAPEERAVDCAGREEARCMAAWLAEHLAHDIRARGNRVLGDPPVERPATPHRRASDCARDSIAEPASPMNIRPIS